MKLVALTQAAARLNVSTVTLYHWIKEGRIRAEYTGANRKRARYITEAEINRVLKEGVRHA